MSRWPVRRLVGLYPRAWRERYGREVGDLTDELISEGRTTRLRAGLELAEGAALEHVRALTRSPAAGLGCVAAITAAAGIGLAVARCPGLLGRPGGLPRRHRAARLVLCCARPVLHLRHRGQPGPAGGVRSPQAGAAQALK
jgi:hypothetical protein